MFDTFDDAPAEAEAEAGPEAMPVAVTVNDAATAAGLESPPPQSPGW